MQEKVLSYSNFLRLLRWRVLFVQVKTSFLKERWFYIMSRAGNREKILHDSPWGIEHQTTGFRSVWVSFINSASGRAFLMQSDGIFETSSVKVCSGFGSFFKSRYLAKPHAGSGCSRPQTNWTACGKVLKCNEGLLHLQTAVSAPHYSTYERLEYCKDQQCR